MNKTTSPRWLFRSGRMQLLRKLNVRERRLSGGGLLQILWKPFTLFYISRVPVQLHPSWLVYPAGIFICYGWFNAGARGVFLAITLLLLLADSLVLHEFAHVFMARRFGVGTRRVLLIPFGAVAELESRLSAPGEFWMALAGPLMSFSIAGLIALAHFTAGVPLRSYSHELGLAVGFGFSLNLVMALFNLLPCFPMDGGRILRSALAIGIGRAFPNRASQALLMATLITVRFVTWPVALGMMALSILWTHAWLHLILFPLLLLLSEIEYWLLRTGEELTAADPASGHVSGGVMEHPTTSKSRLATDRTAISPP